MGSTTKNRPIPQLTEEVTAEWLSTVLNLEIKENSLSLQANTGAGVGFLCNAVRVEFETGNQDGSIKKHNYIIKLLPPPSEQRDYVHKEKMDKAEIGFYEILVPDLLQEIPSLDTYLAPYLYGDIVEYDDEKNVEGASVLIMRDLKKDGYIIKPFSCHKLSKEEINLTLDFFAKFHTASTLLQLRKQKPLNEVYHFFTEWFSNDLEKHLSPHTWLNDGFPHSIKLVTEYVTKISPSDKEEGLEIISKLLKPLAPHAKRLYNLVLKACQNYPGLIHGDVWQNNVLVSSDASKPSVKIIDWQLIGNSDSVNDIAFFLLTSLAPNYDFAEIEKFARNYYDLQEKLFMEKVKERGLDMKTMVQRRSWEEFWQTLKTIGFTFLFIIQVIGAGVMMEFPENILKVYSMFRFFHFEAGLTDFLLEALSK